MGAASVACTRFRGFLHTSTPRRRPGSAAGLPTAGACDTIVIAGRWVRAWDRAVGSAAQLPLRGGLPEGCRGSWSQRGTGAKDEVSAMTLWSSLLLSRIIPTVAHRGFVTNVVLPRIRTSVLPSDAARESWTTSWPLLSVLAR